MKLYKDNLPVPVTKCKRPRFSDHGGRTWDSAQITIDGEPVNSYIDTSWGMFIYFVRAGAWYKMRTMPDSFPVPNQPRYNIDIGDNLTTTIMP